MTLHYRDNEIDLRKPTHNNEMREIELDELFSDPFASYVGDDETGTYQIYLFKDKLVRVVKSKVVDYLDTKKQLENEAIIRKGIELVSQIFDTHTEDTDYDKGCRNVARLFQRILSDDDVEDLE